jgi:hypothetical protein
MKNLYLVFILMGIIFLSCEERFTQVVEIEIPDHNPKMVAYCFIDSNQDSVFVEVSMSQQIMDNMDPYILDASIKLLNGNQLLSDQFKLLKKFAGIDYSRPQMDSIFTYSYVARTGQVFNTGSNYSLEISAAGLDPVYAECTNPEPVQLTSVEFEKDGIIDPDGYTSDEIKIRFNDPGEVNNYYIFSAHTIHRFNGFEYKNPLYLDALDPRVNESSWSTSLVPGIEEYIYFNDKEGINGSENLFSFATFSYEGSEEEEIELVVTLYSISKEMYDFCHAYNQYKNSADIFFAEPVTIPSNFENGYGVFGMYDYTEMRIDL